MATINSSGTTAITTSSDTAVTALTISVLTERVVIVNEGPAPGFFSINSGTTWSRLPAAHVLDLDLRSQPITSGTVKVKRVASGTDLSGVYAFAY